jgi:LysR family transcriptional regulator, regulator for genes of the gallate degradation pathway
MKITEALEPLPGLRKLRIFDAVATAGGLNAASLPLGLSQPAITSALRTLEGEIGVRLLDRGARGSSLSQAGQMLHRRTTRLFAQIEAACSANMPPSHSAAVKRVVQKIASPHVRSLIAMSEAGGVKGAAQALGISQVAIHRSLRQFEQALETPLVRKNLNGLELSRAGSELARRLSVATQEIVSGLEEARALTGRLEARLTIGNLVLAPMRLLAVSGDRVLARRPGSGFEIREGSFEDLTRLLRNGALDMIFGALREPTPYADVATEGFFDDPYVIVCRDGHPLSRRARVQPRDLAPYDWVLPSAGLPRRAVLERIMSDWALRSRARIETTSLSAIIALLAASDRLSLLSKVFMAAGGADHLTALNLRAPQPRRVVGLTTRRDWLATEFQNEFIANLRSACQGIAQDAWQD